MHKEGDLLGRNKEQKLVRYSELLEKAGGREVLRSGEKLPNLTQDEINEFWSLRKDLLRKMMLKDR